MILRGQKRKGIFKMKMFGFLILFTALSALAQSGGPKMLSTMELCSVRVSVGMAKDTVIAKLAEPCNIAKVEGLASDRWFLTKKGIKPKPVAILDFESGRLSRASRSWLPSTDSDYGADGLARALVLAVNSLTDGRDTAVTVRTAVKQDKDVNFYILIIYLANGRQVEVTLMANSTNGKTIMLDVDEAISK